MAEPFRVIGDDDLPPQTPTSPDPLQRIGFEALMLGLKALSQRTLDALSRLFTLLTVASAFWLWMTMPHPDVFQLVSLGGYAAFVLAVNVIVRRA
jgi:hypothetical protein